MMDWQTLRQYLATPHRTQASVWCDHHPSWHVAECDSLRSELVPLALRWTGGQPRNIAPLSARLEALSPDAASFAAWIAVWQLAPVFAAVAKNETAEGHIHQYVQHFSGELEAVMAGVLARPATAEQSRRLAERGAQLREQWIGGLMMGYPLELVGVAYTAGAAGRVAGLLAWQAATQTPARARRSWLPWRRVAPPPTLGAMLARFEVDAVPTRFNSDGEPQPERRLKERGRLATITVQQAAAEAVGEATEAMQCLRLYMRGYERPPRLGEQDERTLFNNALAAEAVRFLVDWWRVTRARLAVVDVASVHLR